MRFPLDKQNVIGYDYGVPTDYGVLRHTGVDWEAVFAPLYAPKDGKILSTIIAPEGGLTMQFQATGEDKVIRWLHLSKFLASPDQSVKEGQQIAITGDSGHRPGSNAAYLPHLHEDIWKSKVTLKFKDTLNPHEYYEGASMNQTKVVLSKDGKTVFLATPVAMDFENFKKQASVEGITIPDPIPPASSL